MSFARSKYDMGLTPVGYARWMDLVRRVEALEQALGGWTWAELSDDAKVRYGMVSLHLGGRPAVSRAASPEEKRKALEKELAERTRRVLGEEP